MVRQHCGRVSLVPALPFMVSRLETSGVLRIDVGILDPLIYDNTPTIIFDLVWEDVTQHARDRIPPRK